LKSVKVLFLFLLAVLALASAIVAGMVAFLRRFLPATQGRVQLAGLTGTVEILRDRFGVPHIYAESEDDLFFAQGYVHAQDRLWQMELQRRAGAGRLSEILGEATLEIDRHFRTLGLNRAAEAEAATLAGESARVLEAYAAGVNAYMQQQRGRLSLEFALLRHEPQPWRPVDSLYWVKVMSANLGCNWTSELIRARLAAKLGADLAADLEPAYPATNPPTIAGAGVPAGQAAPPNGWGSSALRDSLKLVEGLLGGPARPRARPAPPLGIIHLDGGASNQWVVDGAHSATGKPLLANDTHMPVAMPALWHQVHLVGGRYDVTGASFPGTPGVVVGHNRHCAWGLTTAWHDAQDLYVEKANPANPAEFEFEGRWERAQVIQEIILVKGRPEPVVEEVMITRHGPLVSKLVGEEQPLALRWVALERSDLLRAVIEYDRAGSWEEFRAALAHWSTPSHNFVYADVDGTIGTLQAGWMPVRATGYGMAPAPGWTGEHEWQRYLALDELPQVINPAQGWIGVANNLVVDDAYPHFLSTDLENPVRARRVADLLEGQASFSAADFARFQLDTASAQAQRFVRHLLVIQPTNTREAEALQLLKDWDYRLDATSVAASIYAVCRLQALHVVFDPPLGELADSYIGVDVTDMGGVGPYHGRSFVRLLDMLDNARDTTWLRDPETGIPQPKVEVLHRSLRIALKLLKERLGPDMAQWTWGRLNQVQFAHPVGSVKPLNLLFNRGPYPMAGDGDTLLRAIAKPEFPFKPVAVVAALRFVADVGDWDRCQMIIPGGQSGHVASPHYADLIPLWRDGITLSMPFTRTAVERNASERLVLVKSGGRQGNK
jgi:penicillin amidase